MNLESHVSDFRYAVGDISFHESRVINLLNRAILFLNRHPQLKYAQEDSRTFSSVANQDLYSLPSIYANKTLAVRFDDRPMDMSKTKADFEQMAEGARYTTGTPYHCIIWAKQLQFYYIPDEDADTCTVTIASATATIATADDTSNFPDRGRFIVGTEVIGYTAKTSTSFTGLTRGLEGTIAAAHTSATATERNIEWFGFIRPGEFIDKPGAGNGAAASGGGQDAGDHLYYMSFYSTSLKRESLLYNLGKITTTVANNRAAFSNLAMSSDSDVDYKRIYRVLVADATKSSPPKYFVAQVLNGATSYNDDYADNDISGNDIYNYPESDYPGNFHDVITYKALEIYFREERQHNLAREYERIVKEAIMDLIIQLMDERTPSYPEAKSVE